MVISIMKANYKGDFKIEFVFSDDTIQTIDFRSFLMNSKNPMTKKYQNEELFKNYTIEYGDIQWNDFELCFPVWDLHQGTIQ